MRASVDDVPLKKLAVLGRGGSGVVEKVVSTVSGKEYARKLLPRGQNFQKNKDILQKFEKELATLKRLSHIHIVQLGGSYTDPKYGFNVLNLRLVDSPIVAQICRYLNDSRGRVQLGRIPQTGPDARPKNTAPGSLWLLSGCCQLSA
jgi:serine/threonine protein kinase